MIFVVRGRSKSFGQRKVKERRISVVHFSAQCALVMQHLNLLKIRGQANMYNIVELIYRLSINPITVLQEIKPAES